MRARPATWGYTARKFIERNRLGVAAAGLVGMALMGGVAGTLWQARRAERRFEDVRALAHAFLFEFHDSIRDLPGSIPARRLLVSRALEYLGRLVNDAGGGDVGLRRELVAAYLQVGDVQGRPNRPNLGDTAGALASYRRAVALADVLPQGDDASAVLRASAWDSLANLLAGTGQPAEAGSLVARALALREELLARQPDDFDCQRAVAASLVSGGDIALSNAIAASSQLASATEAPDRPTPYAQAMKAYLRALALRTRLHALRPSDEAVTRELAGVHYRLGNVFFVLGVSGGDDRAQLQRGLDHHRLSVSLGEANLSAHPMSGQARRELADGLSMKTDVQTRLGDPAGALADCRRAIALFEGLVAADPENVWLRQDLACACCFQAAPERALGDVAGALVSLDRAIALFEALAAADPTNLIPVAHLDHCLRGRTEICAEAGDAERPAGECPTVDRHGRAPRRGHAR